MKELMIIGGVNGCGKTTFAKEYLSSHNYLFLNADEIQIEPAFKNQNALAAGKEFLNRLDAVKDSNQIILLESTLSR